MIEKAQTKFDFIDEKTSKKYINNPKIKKIVDFIGYLAYLGIIIFIFDNHTSHYLNSL